MNIFTSIKSLALTAALTVAIHAGAAKKPTGDIVISKVFYAGTTKAGTTKNYTGGEEYLELHNNSGTEYDLAGMYIGLLESEGSTGAYLAGTLGGNMVALKQVFQIPTDREWLIQPYGTIVIAASAMNHAAEAQDGPDLSAATLEFGNETYDNPAVPNLTLVYTFNAKTTKVNLTNGGDAGLVLISQKNGDKYVRANDAASLVYANGKTTGSQYLKFNAYYAMDRVEILKTTGEDSKIDAARKRFTESNDKGYVPADGHKMNKDGYVAYRKTALNHAGKHKILYKTGDSSTDWQVSDAIQPLAYDDAPAGTTAFTVDIPESGFLPFNAQEKFYTAPGLYVGYVNASQVCTAMPGDSAIYNNSPYLLIGAPGEHTVYYTQAQRNIATAGIQNWLLPDDNFYNAAAHEYVYTGNANRYPLKFVAEKGNVRFVADMVNGNPKSMKIDLDTESPLYIRLTTTATELKWTGITPAEVVATAIGTVPTTATASHTAAATAIYSLAGQQVDAAYKGIVVRNGRKHIQR